MAILDLYVNAFDNVKVGWYREGSSPYLDVQDEPTNYVSTSAKKAECGDFGFADSGKSSEVINSVYLYIYHKTAGKNGFSVFLNDGSSDTELDGWQYSTGGSYEWHSEDVSVLLNTWTKIDSAKIYLKNANSTDEVAVDCAYLKIDYTAGGASYTKTFDADAFLEKTQVKTFDVDAFLQAIKTKTLDIDARLIKRHIKTLDIDALLQKTQTKTFISDAILEKEQTKTFVIDAILSQVTTYIKTLVIDAILKSAQTKTFDIDAFLQKTYVKTLDTDALLQKEGTKTSNIDAFLQAIYTKTSDVDAILQSTPIKTFDVDAFLQKPYAKTFEIDAILKYVQIKTFDINAILKATKIKSFDVDAFLKATQTKTFDIDAILKFVKTKTFDADAILQATQTKTFLVDAIITAIKTKTFDADALLESVFTRDFLSDAILLKSSTKTFTTDAILTSVTTYTKTFTIDAVIGVPSAFILEPTKTMLIRNKIYDTLNALIDGIDEEFYKFKIYKQMPQHEALVMPCILLTLNPSPAVEYMFGSDSVTHLSFTIDLAFKGVNEKTVGGTLYTEDDLAQWYLDNLTNVLENVDWGDINLSEQLQCTGRTHVEFNDELQTYLYGCSVNVTIPYKTQ